MSNDRSIADRIGELRPEEYSELIRICEARKQREDIGGASVVSYEPDVPENIAEILEERGLAHRLGSMTAATEAAYRYYLDNIVST